MSACHAGPVPITFLPVENPQDLTLKVLRSDSICGGITHSQWIAREEDYQNVLQSMGQQARNDSAPQSLPVDFTRSGVLLVSMGQQRTGGYAISLANQQLHIANSTAIVEVRWQEPKPGMMLTQMLTNPCLFIEVPRGEYKTIEVHDQSQQIRASVEIN